MGKESLEVLARMTDTEIEVRDIVDRWLLLTYDLPCDEKGNKARREFLLEAKSLGATRHTDSVYLMPWTTVAEHLALQLARVGEVVVWTSVPTDESKNRQLTVQYDRGIEPILDEIGGRIDRIQEHFSKRRMKRGLKMMEKTERMLDQVEQAIIRRGSVHLMTLLTLLQRRFGQV